MFIAPERPHLGGGSGRERSANNIAQWSSDVERSERRDYPTVRAPSPDHAWQLPGLADELEYMTARRRNHYKADDYRPAGLEAPRTPQPALFSKSDDETARRRGGKRRDPRPTTPPCRRYDPPPTVQIYGTEPYFTQAMQPDVTTDPFAIPRGDRIQGIANGDGPAAEIASWDGQDMNKVFERIATIETLESDKNGVSIASVQSRTAEAIDLAQTDAFLDHVLKGVCVHFRSTEHWECELMLDTGSMHSCTYRALFERLDLPYLENTAMLNL